MDAVDTELFIIRFRSYPMSDLLKWARGENGIGADAARLARAEIGQRLRADGVPPLADEAAWERFAPTVRE